MRFLPILLLLAAACGDSPVEPPPPAPTELRVTAPDSLLRVGDSLRVEAEVLDQKGRPLAGSDIVWSSSDANRATVSPAGVVTAIRRGSVAIVASVGTLSDTVLLRVHSPLLGISLSHDGQAAPVGRTRQLVPQLRVEPDTDASSITVRFRSDHPEIATVSSSGVVTARSPGTATIHAWAEDVSTYLYIYVVRGFDLTVLGSLGGTGSRARAVNANGEVVGEAQDASGAWRAVLWRGGVAVDLKAPGARSRATAVSTAGDVVGVYWPTADTTLATRAFLWRAGSATPLDPPAEAEHVFATDVDERGVAVGYTLTACASCPGRSAGNALVWESGTVRDLGRFGGHQAIVTAIDGAGRIYGSVQPADSAVVVAGGFVERIFPGVAVAVSGAGHVAGHSRWDQFYVWRDDRLHAHSVGRRTGVEVRGIDARGEVLLNTRYSYFTPLTITPHLLQQDGRLLRLNDMIATVTPWRVDEALGMNDAGVAVGYGRAEESGPVRALVLRPRP